MRKIFLFLFCCIPVMEVCSCSDYEEYMPEEDVLQERQMSVAQADEKLLDAVFHESSQSWVYLQGDPYRLENFQKVYDNLVLNSAEFAEVGEEEFAVKLRNVKKELAADTKKQLKLKPTHYAVKVLPKTEEEQRALEWDEQLKVAYVPFDYVSVPESQVSHIRMQRTGAVYHEEAEERRYTVTYEGGMDASATTVYSPVGRQDASSYTRWNREFQAYSLKQSRYMDGFWIGSGDPGLFYYSFEDKALHSVENLPAQPTEIHGIYEENDSVLYVVTAGSGFHKLILEKQAGTIRFKSQKSYHFFHGQREITMFYPMLPEGDSILWLGSREKGLVRFDKRTEEYKVISLKEMLHKSVDDVLSLYRTKEGLLYVGTTSGLVCLNSNGKQMKATYIGREQGLLNDMIHGVLEDENGLLWLGTNRGLIKYNPINGSSHAYFYSAGVQIGEFSDDAYYMCPYTQELFFGGIDGLLYLDKEVQAAPEFYPDILLRKLTVGHTQVVQGDRD